MSSELSQSYAWLSTIKFEVSSRESEFITIFRQKKAEKEAQAHIAEGLLVTQRAQEVLNAIKAEKKRQEEEVRRKREEEQRLAEEARRKAEEARRAEEEAALRARQEREAAAAKEKAEGSLLRHKRSSCLWADVCA